MKSFSIAPLLVLSLALACQERLHHPPAPPGIPPEATRDRYGIWERRPGNGEYRRWYPDGKLARTGTFKDGGRHGTFRNYALDGETLIAKGDYRDNWRDGVWNFYDSQGRLYLTIRYAPQPRREFLFLKTQDYGNENGPYERYYPDGTLEEQGEFWSGYYHGPIRRYHRDGTRALIGRFEKDKKVGLWRTFYPNGEPEREETFADDKLDGPLRVYYEDGRLYYETLYAQGKEVGPGLLYPR